MLPRYLLWKALLLEMRLFRSRLPRPLLLLSRLPSAAGVEELTTSAPVTPVPTTFAAAPGTSRAADEDYEVCEL